MRIHPIPIFPPTARHMDLDHFIERYPVNGGERVEAVIYRIAV